MIILDASKAYNFLKLKKQMQPYKVDLEPFYITRLKERLTIKDKITLMEFNESVICVLM